jgi:hypothetical protein
MQRQVEAFLARYPTEARELAHAARSRLADALPGAQESVDTAAKLLAYSYGPGYKGLVCTLIMSKTGVKLGIFRGAELPDPAGLLQGTGKVHRHVQLRRVEDLDRPGLRHLLETALAAWRKRSSTPTKRRNPDTSRKDAPATRSK